MVLAYSISELIKDLSNLIPDVETELNNRVKGVPGNGDEEQLRLILDELKNIRTMAEQNKLPPKSSRWTAFSRYVVDEWDLSNLLGKQLCELADSYKNKIL